MLMRLLSAALPMLLVSGCVVEIPEPVDPPENPLCPGTRAARADVAADVAVTSDDNLALSSSRLVEIIDAGCAQ